MSKKKHTSIPNKNNAIPQPLATETPSVLMAESKAFDAVAVTTPDLKNVFIFSLLFMLVAALFFGYNAGYHADEIDMNNYCKANFAFYATGGKDTTHMGVNTMDDTRIDPVLRYYGSGFDYLPVGINKLLGTDKGPLEFTIRHFFIQIFGVLAILFAGLIAYEVGGWVVALFTVWLLFLTPTFLGAIYFNSKDIPFTTGYVATVYFIIQFVNKLPKPDWKTTLGLLLAFAFTTSIRVGGIMLLGFFGLWFVVSTLIRKDGVKEVLQHFGALAVKVGAVVVGGFALVILTWPFVLKDPLHNIAESFSVVKKFPVIIRLTFEGEYTDSLHIPPHYLPKIMSITIPVFILIAIVLGIITVLLKWKEKNGLKTCFIILITFFPIIYAVISNVALYSGWRHFLFVYPGLCIIAAFGLANIYGKIKLPVVRIALPVVCILSLSHPLYWMVKNHPYEYSYFNEISGGFEKAYTDYEVDYWEITAQPALEWLMKQDAIKNAKDSVLIGTNIIEFTNYYVKNNYKDAKVRFVYAEEPNRFGEYWTYGIFHSLFLSPDYMEKFFPPCKSIHTEGIEGKPLIAVIKDTVRLDWAAKEAFQKNNFPLCDSLLTQYLQKDCPGNVGLYGVMALVKGYVNKNEESIKYGELSIKHNILEASNYNALCGMGVAYANMKRYDSSASKLNQAINLLPQNALAHNLMNALQNLQK